MRALRSRRYLAALPVGILAAALATGIPTDIVPNPWFTRMTPVRALDLVLWPLTSVVVGALAATFVFGLGGDRRPPGVAAGSGIAATFAIGCPVCNKLVVALLGISGALNYFAPIQPVLGLGALALAVWALRQRVASLERGCTIMPSPAVPS